MLSKNEAEVATCLESMRRKRDMARRHDDIDWRRGRTEERKERRRR
jgi:hypothetical protein